MTQPGKRPRILLVTHSGFTEGQADEIKSLIPEAEFITAPDNAVLGKVNGINALIGCTRSAFTEELLERAGPSLQWVHASGAGVEEFIFPKFTESRIVFTNGKIIQGPEVADHALGLLLTLTRNLQLVLRGKTQNMPRAVELYKKNALVIGLGGIGLLIAERAAAFGMRVSGVNPEMLPFVRALEHVYPPDRLDEALPDADAVFLATPVTPLTRLMFGKKQFNLMKKTSYFVNVCRGITVNTTALVDALKEGNIRGAGLDVTDPEPLPHDHPLRSMDNVVITPHIAGHSDHNRQRSFELIKTNIYRFVNGLPLLNIVDKQLGY